MSVYLLAGRVFIRTRTQQRGTRTRSIRRVLSCRACESGSGVKVECEYRFTEYEYEINEWRTCVLGARPL